MTSPHPNTFSGTEMPDLQELQLPPAINMFPETLAWKILFLSLICLVVVAALYLFRRQRRRMWRRQAIRLASECAHADDWFLLIRRICLLHIRREDVVGLSDSDLLSRVSPLDPASRQALLTVHYRRDAQLDADRNSQVRRAVLDWVKGLPDV